jgi:CDP-paratose 2-epimerase
VRARGKGHAVVTGGAGFIGTNVASRLVEDGSEVVVLDDLSRPGVRRNLTWLLETYGGRVRFEHADIRDREALRGVLAGARSVVHLAAQVAVTTSLDAPLQDFGVNAQGTVTLLEELRRLDEPPFLLFTSTNKVYGSLPTLALELVDKRWTPVDEAVRERGLSEAQPLDFCTPYGCSKGAADQYVLDYAKSYGLPAVVFRMSCIYGPHQHGNEDQGWVAHFAIKALRGEPITLYGDGAQVRDILYVDDLVEAMLLAREHIGTTAGLAFNMGGGAENAVSLLEVLELLAELNGDAVRMHFDGERAGDQRYYVADSGRFRAATGWQPTIGAQEGVERLVAWLAEEHAGERALRAVAR